MTVDEAEVNKMDFLQAGMAVSRMHNGVVGGFMRIRRMLLSHLSDAAYDTIQSFHSDSAICFAIFLNFLPDLVSEHSSHTQLEAMEVRCPVQCMQLRG